MLLRVIDFETTNLPPDCAICQIGRTDVLHRGGKPTILEPGAMFVNPEREIAPEARAIHHIRDRDVKDAPPVDLGLRSLMQANGHGEPDVFAAHNAKFERDLFDGGGKPWICTRKIAMRLWPDAPNHQNQTLRYFLGIDGQYDFEAHLAMPPHRAGPDTYVTAHILARALVMESAEQLIRWSNEPSLLPGNIGFGKHKGLPWSQVPGDYLDWIVSKSDMDYEVKFTARHWLARRRSDDR